MHSRTLSSLQRQRGYTLMEILVAVAIFAVVMIVALLLYDQSNRVFKQANEAAEMQQNTRVAFEKVVSDLRMAGFDYKRAGTPKAGVPQPWTKDTDYSMGTYVTPDAPNGHVYRATKSGKSGALAPTWKTTPVGVLIPDNTTEWQESGAPVYEQPDEQIEFVHDRAITIRANFDYEDPTTPDHGREQDLQDNSGGRFPIVTTGNDEIVTYALVSRSGNNAANQNSIRFFADVHVKSGNPARLGYPGGSAEREITIPGVDFTNQYPPYTLMRYTLDASGNPVATALADNIRSMTFSYWQDYAAKEPLTDIANVKIDDFTTVAGLGAYNPAAPTALVAQRLIRGKVRAVTATIVGMSPQPDRDYTNPADTVAKNYRQYELQSTIVGRNLGMKGIPQAETDPPGPPIMGVSCNGYCGMVYLTWAPAPGTGNVTYTVLYDTSATGSFAGVLPAGSQTSYAVDLTQFDLTRTYYFRVAATNDAGTTVSEGNPLALNLRNVTKPNVPTNVLATGKQDFIEVKFTPGAGNASGNPACSDGSPAPALNFPSEVRGYRIYRSKDVNFDPDAGEGTLVLNEQMSGLIGDGAGNFTFLDKDVVNCTDYYYKVAAVEWCEANANYNVSGDKLTGMSAWSAASAVAQSTATAKAKTPLTLKQDVSSFCDPIENLCGSPDRPVKLNWEKVIKDVSENDIKVERYRITRRRNDEGTPSLDTTITIDEGAATTWSDTDKLPHHDPADATKTYTYEYKVYALNCALESDPATLVYPGVCVTGATIVPDGTGPGDGTLDSPMENVESLAVVGHQDHPIKQVEVSIDGSDWAAIDPFELEWDIRDGEVHTVAFRVTTEDCVETLYFYVVADPADCALRMSVSEVIGSPSVLRVRLVNVGENDVFLDNFSIKWLGQTGPTLSWTDIVLPSGDRIDVSPVSPATDATPRTFTVRPDNLTDQFIRRGQTYDMTLVFTGGTAQSGRIGALNADYRERDITTLFGCGPTVVSCTVSATTSALADTDIINVDIKNTSTETITVNALRITWSGQANWTWLSLTADATYPVSTAVSSGTELFPTGPIAIGPGDTYRATMKMKSDRNNPPNLVANNVTTVWVAYRTPNSAQAVLTCRAK